MQRKHEGYVVNICKEKYHNKDTTKIAHHTFKWHLKFGGRLVHKLGSLIDANPCSKNTTEPAEE